MKDGIEKWGSLKNTLKDYWKNRILIENKTKTNNYPVYNLLNLIVILLQDP